MGCQIWHFRKHTNKTDTCSSRLRVTLIYLCSFQSSCAEAWSCFLPFPLSLETLGHHSSYLQKHKTNTSLATKQTTSCRLSLGHVQSTLPPGVAWNNFVKHPLFLIFLPFLWDIHFKDVFHNVPYSSPLHLVLATPGFPSAGLKTFPLPALSRALCACAVNTNGSQPNSRHDLEPQRGAPR